MKKHPNINDRELINNIQQLATELGIPYRNRSVDAVQADISDALKNVGTNY